jgi:hypothetical protein
MRRFGIGAAMVILLCGCTDNLRSTRSWAELEERLAPDERSDDISRYLDAIPSTHGRDAFTWTLGDGTFSAIFYADSAGDSRLLYGLFTSLRTAESGTAQRTPSDSDVAAMRRLQAHWRQPDPDIRATVRQLREASMALGDDADRAHAARLCDTFLTALDWKAAHSPDPCPVMLADASPDDLDRAWSAFFATGDERFLRYLSATAVRAKPMIAFIARWSMDANMTQDPALRQRFSLLSVAGEEQRILRLVLGRSDPARN